MATCPTATVEPTAYDAKGTPMLLGVCPACGRELRHVGRYTPGMTMTISAHTTQEA